MRRILRSILRGLFGTQALIWLVAAAVGMRHKGYEAQAIHEPIGYYIAAIALMLPPALAYLSLLKAKPGKRNYWAAINCLLDVFVALPLLYFARPVGLSLLAFGWSYLALNLAGVWLFLQKGTASKSSPQSNRLAGDRTSRFTDALFSILLFVGSWQIWRLWRHWAGLRSEINTRFPWDLLVLFVAALLMAAVHECGHAFVASIFQMKLLSFTVGPFSWRRIEGRWRFRFMLSALGGSVTVVSILPQPDWQEILMLTGGAAANLVTTPVFFLASLRFRGIGHDYLLYFFALLSVFSLAGAIFNLFPLRVANSAYSDGAQILQILTNSPALEYRRAINQLQAALFTPLRARDLDPIPFQRVAASRVGTLVALHAHLCAAGIFEDRGEIHLAYAEIASAEACYNDFSIDLPAILHNIFIYHYAVYRQDAAATRLWWDRMVKKKIERKNVNHFMSVSALAWMEGRHADAEDAWRLAEAETKKLPAFGAYNRDREEVALLRASLNGPAPAPAATSVASESVKSPEAQPAALASDRKPLLIIATASAVLLATVTIAPTVPLRAMLWHYRHGNSAQLAGYRVHVPLLWQASTRQYHGVGYTSLERTAPSGYLRQTPYISISPPDSDPDDPPAESDEQLLEQMRRQIDLVNRKVPGSSATLVILKTRHLALYCEKIVYIPKEMEPDTDLWCRTPHTTNYFSYYDPSANEPEAESILSSVQ
jgi:Zn-dependent protease